MTKPKTPADPRQSAVKATAKAPARRTAPVPAPAPRVKAPIADEPEAKEPAVGNGLPAAAAPAIPAARVSDPAAHAAAHNEPDPVSRRRTAPVEKEETVTVRIPQDFKLHDDAGVVHQYRAGTDEMPMSHAEHFYAKANGVEIYDAKKKP